MEQAFGTDFSAVRVHTGAESQQLNDRVQASAFTTGNDIWFRDGMPDADNARDQHLVAHELTHVVQQRGGQPGGVQRHGRPGIAIRSHDAGVHRQSVVRRKGGAGKATSEAPLDLDGLKAKKESLQKEKTDLELQIKDQTDKVARSSFLAKVAANSTLKKLQKRLQKVQADLGEVGTQIAPLQLQEDERLRLAAEAEEKQRRQEERARKKKEAAERQAKIDAETYAYSRVAGLGLPKLVEYTTATANWHEHSSMTEDKRKVVNEVVAFAAVPENQAACSTWTVAEMEAGAAALSMSLKDAIAWLPRYVAAAGERRDPIQISRQTLEHAVRLGHGIDRLLSAFPRWVLAGALKEQELIDLVYGGYVDDIITYFQFGASPPLFQAETGADFSSYLKMRKNDGVDPASYQGGPLSAYVRNFHRFEAATLKALDKNLADTSKKKPLTLILHTAIDHNGAFHRDPYMTQVFTNKKNLTLMIEGGETLAAYQSQIGPLATTYGNNDKLDQVMFAGHGNSRLIEMAGTATENTYTPEKYGTIKQSREDIDLENDKDAALAFFDEILDHMDKSVVDKLAPPGPDQQANRRILFNACLTNSNTVPIALTKDRVKARKEITDYIENNASLATFMANYAKSKGADVTSLGANASITQVELIKPDTGALDLVAPTDEFVTSSKLTYMEKGTEPHGVLLAALEAWAYQPAEARAALVKRAAKKSDDWDQAVIEGCFELASMTLNHQAFGTILQLLADTAHHLSELKLDHECRVSTLTAALKPWGADAAWRTALVHRLAAGPLVGANGNVALVMRQVQAGTLGDSAALTTLIQTVLPNFNASTARDYLDVKYLVESGQMATAMGRTASKGTILMALLGMLSPEKPNVCKNHLQSVLHPGAPLVPKLPAVDPVPEVPEGVGPRAEIPAVAKVKGRKKVPAIPEANRKEHAAVPDLKALPKLPAVAGPPEVTASKEGAKAPAAPKAPGREARAGRPEAPEVAAVKPFFETKHGVEELLAGRSTAAAIAELVKA